MSQFETMPTQTHTLINYNAANDHHLHRLCRTSRLPDFHEEPLKKFHQYFGKIQPSLYQELKSIFQNSSFEEPSDPQQLEYHVQGVMLGTRGRQVRPRGRKQLSPIGNQFTIESIQTRNIYRKAKLNRLIDCSHALQDSLPEEETQALLRQSDQLVSQLHSTLTTKRVGRHCSQGSTQRSFRVSKASGSVDKDSLLYMLNPTNRERFTMADLNQALCLLHNVEIQLSPSISYFNVFVQEGNNSQLLKTLIRKRNGWRVVELPAVANLIWTQFYRRGVLKKRLHRREKSETEEDREKMTLRTDPKRLKMISSDKRYEIRGSELSPNKSTDEGYTDQLRKLVPPCDAQDVAKFKRSTMKMLKPVQITQNVLIHNHFPFNSCISDKKNLLLHLTKFLKSKNKNVFEVVPQSFELSDLTHPVISTLQAQKTNKQHWLIKPGENSNRGRGITIVHSSQEALDELKRRLMQEEQQGENTGQRQSIPQRRKRRSVILQRYIKPLLYWGRKFDIRSYMLVTFLNGQLRMYCYQECYIRTSSKCFDIDSPNRLVHLTNDAVQSHSPDYGKFEEGNKVAENIFARFIDDEYRRKHPNSSGVWHNIKGQMRNKCIDVLEASYQTLLKGVHKAGQQNQENYYFQLFGMDFMVDQNFGLWLIQVNTNPAITHDCSRVLNHLIPRMLDNAFAIAIEPIMRPLRLHDLPYSNLFTAAFKKVVS